MSKKVNAELEILEHPGIIGKVVGPTSGIPIKY